MNEEWSAKIAAGLFAQSAAYVLLVHQLHDAGSIDKAKLAAGLEFLAEGNGNKNVEHWLRHLTKQILAEGAKTAADVPEALNFELIDGGKTDDTP